MEPKIEGVLALKNLLIANHSLKAKFIFQYLNSAESVWVAILRLKYGHLNFWKDPIPSKCSWFFRGLCWSASTIKPYCWIKTINPSSTSILYDP